MKPYVIAITGASGTVYAFRLIQTLLEIGREVIVLISDSARRVIREESGTLFEGEITPASFGDFLGDVSGRCLKVYSVHDLAAPVASGSYPVEAMMIVPCSMGTLGAIASGVSLNLIHRAADCALKEKRRLILVPRETPLHAVHLENMLKLSRMGARIVPPMPAFYTRPKTIEEMIDFVVGKILDQLDITHGLYPRWVGPWEEKCPK